MGLPLRRGSQQATPALEALRELRAVVNKVLESGQHAGLERARAEAQLGLLTVYDLQVQSCECKRGFCLVPRVAKARPLLGLVQPLDLSDLVDPEEVVAFPFGDVVKQKTVQQWRASSAW